MDASLFRDLGLNDSETRTYFALLEFDETTVGPLVERAKVPDSKIYAILEKLKEKGLASYVIKNNVKHFQASDPKNLLRILREKEEEIARQKREIEESVIPQIAQRKSMRRDAQEATVYESYEGLKAAFNLILEGLDKGEEYQVFMLGDALGEKAVIRFFENYHAKRIAKGITARLVCNERFRSVVLAQHKRKGMRIRFTGQDVPVGTFIFKGKVMTVLWEAEPAAFVISSRQNHEHYKKFFEDVWKSATA